MFRPLARGIGRVTGMASDPRATLVKLLDAFEDREAQRRAELDALIVEMRALVTGGETIGQKLAAVKAHWCAAWTERHHEKCAFDHVKHTAALKKKLATFTVEEISVKISSYLASEEAYYVRARHPFSLFLTSFDSWRGLTAASAPLATGLDDLRQMRGER